MKQLKHRVKFLKSRAKQPKNEIIIFIHGLFRSYWSMYLLARYFRKQGYDCYLFDYPSTRHSLSKNIETFYTFLDKCLKNHPTEKVHIISHSMGGIIARGAMEKLSLDRYQHIESIVMLVPPSQGSPYAERFLSFLPRLEQWIKPLSDISTLEHAHVHKLSDIHHPKIGIIAAKYDKKSPSKLAHLPTQKDFLEINVTHSLVIDHPKTKKAIENFINTGKF